jgi:hypothetical protein
MENPSFVAGAAGGCGSVWLKPDGCVASRFDDFVSRPIASTVSAGARHARRFAMPVLSDFVGCITCPRNNRACKRSMGSPWAWQDRHKIMPKCRPRRPHCYGAFGLPAAAPKGLRLTGKIVHAASIPRSSGDGFEPVWKK